MKQKWSMLVESIQKLIDDDAVVMNGLRNGSDINKIKKNFQRNTKNIGVLIEEFGMFPGIGPKTAERLAFFTILNLEKDDVERFSKALISAKESLRYCSVCGAITDLDICDICSDLDRENKILVVENTKDVITFEKTNQFRGKYHVLNGVISSSQRIGPNQLNVGKLLERVES